MNKTIEKQEYIIKELQKKELSMLRLFSEIMDRNNIPYFLACGTMLGCIRHAGFIPWDDDVDIYIFGEDYPKLKEVFLSQDTGILELHDYTTKANYPYSFPKIVAKDTVLIEKSLSETDYKCGVYIDVFLLPGTSNNSFIRTVLEVKRYFYYCLLRAYYFNFKTKKRKFISHFVRKLINPVKVQRKLYNYYMKKIGDSKYLVDTGVFWKHALLRRSLFDSSVRMTFESIELPVPADYEAYLTDYYGDYMQLPNKEDRVSNHCFEKLIINDKQVI